jgi:hypothetical protein
MLTQEPSRFAVVEKGPNPALIEWPEGLLKDARIGELQGVAAVFEWKDGAVGEGWAVSGNQRYRMLGALTVLEFKLAQMEA